MFQIVALMIMAAAKPEAPAKPQVFGKWQAKEEQGHRSVYTINDSLSLFGFVCAQKGCMYVVQMGNCIEGKGYGLLMASTTAGGTVPAACLDFAGRPSFFVDPEAIESLLDGSEIAFAWPIESTGLKVSKFSLEGARKAVAWVNDQRARSGAAGDASKHNAP